MRPSTLVNWCGPFQLTRSGTASLLATAKALQHGIYVWTIRVRGVHWTYYLGETGKSFLERHLEHIGLYYEGQNRIYEPRALARGNKRIVWDWAMGPSNRARRASFRKRFARWAPSVQRFLAILNVFLIPYGGDKRSRERLEAGLWRLAEFNGGGRYQEEGIRFRSCREGERHLLVRFARPLPVEGLRRLRTLELPIMADAS